MLKKKSIKLFVLGLLMPVFLIGCPYTPDSAQQNETPVDNQSTNNSELSGEGSEQENKDQSMSDAKQVYDELFSKYKEFAKYIYKVDQNGQAVNKESKAIQTGEKPALGTLTQEFQQKISTKPEDISGNEFKKAYDAFEKLKGSNNDFQTKLADLANKTQIESQAQSIQDAIDKLNPYLELLNDGTLTTDEIGDYQTNSGLKKDDDCCTFGDITYKQVENVLQNTTLTIGQILNEIQPLIISQAPVQAPVQLPVQPPEKQPVNILFLIVLLLLLIAIPLLLWHFKLWNKLPKWLDKIKKQVKSTISRNPNGIHSTASANHSIPDQGNITDWQSQMLTLEKQMEALQNNFSSLGMPKREEFLELETKITQLESKVDILLSTTTNKEEYLRDEDRDSSSVSNEQRLMKQNVIPTNYVEQSDYAPLITSYTNNPRSFVQQGTKVRMTTETTNKVLDGTWNGEVNFEEYRNGEYWIISNDNRDEYVFLDPMTKFNPQTLQLIHKSKLFICHGNLFNTVKGEEIKVRKPAKVRRNGQYWTLVESGELILS